MPEAARADAGMRVLENRTCDELRVGDVAQVTRTLLPENAEAVSVSNQTNDPGAGSDSDAPCGPWSAGLIQELLSTRLPGPGTAFLDLVLHFRRAAKAGDT